MTLYVKNNTLFHISEVRRLHPNTSLPDDGDATSIGYEKLIASVPPAPLPWHMVDQVAPVNNTQTWQQIPLTQQEIVDQVTKKTQARLDQFAQTRGYDNMQSLANYAGDEDPVFDLEGTYGKRMRSQTWRAVIDLMRDIEFNIRSLPESYELIELELPVLVWPN